MKRLIASMVLIVIAVILLIGIDIGIRSSKIKNVEEQKTVNESNIVCTEYKQIGNELLMIRYVRHNIITHEDNSFRDIIVETVKLMDTVRFPIITKVRSENKKYYSGDKVWEAE